MDLIEKAGALGSDGNAEEIEVVRREVETIGDLYTALYLAAVGSKPTAAALLLQARADVHEGTHGTETPLHVAKTADCVSLLLAARADPARFDGEGRTPLHVVAALFGSGENAKQLIEAKADVNLPVAGDTFFSEYRNKTPLILAIEKGNLEVVAVLLEADGLDLAKDLCSLVRAEGPTAVECLQKIPKEARLWLRGVPAIMERAHIREQLRVILAKGDDMEYTEGSQKFSFDCGFNDEYIEYITLGSQNLFTRPEVQASLKYIPGLFASDACNPELLKSLAYTTNDEVFHTHTVAALVQAAWMQTRLATAGEVFVSLLMLPLLCHASFTLRHEQPHFADPGH